MKNIHVERYQLLKNAYDGGGGFADGSYLTRHHREITEKYNRRKELSHYLNYLRPCIDAHVAPIFKTPAVRSVEHGTGADVWRAFLDNVDFTGTTIEKLMKRAATLAKLHGAAFLVMDRVNDGEPPTTVAGLSERRENIPYAFVVEPGRVLEIKTDRYGRLTMFQYTETDETDDEKVAVRTLYADHWTLTDAENKTTGGAWSLGRVPVVALYAVDHDPLNPFPVPPFLSIAKAEKAIFNRCSWLDDILINQTFSILTYPSNDLQNGLMIGTNNAIGYPADASHEPGFISPSADPVNALRESIKDLQQECYRMAAVVNVTGVREQASGVAKMWDFEQTNQILTGYADTLEDTERQLSELFKAWTGTEFEYTVNYPNDFSISDVETELANAEIAVGLHFGDAFNLEVYKRILMKYLPEIKRDDVDVLVEEYRKELETQKNDYVHDSAAPFPFSGVE